jgi:DNA-binding CsgD family transcriptional regulator/tetratricopeptide (TPR) repeat protein
MDHALNELADRSTILRLEGEPGIGKSRMLAELAARGIDRGFLALGGRSAEFEADVPFAVFVDALDDFLAGLDRRALAALDPAVIAHLAAVFPALQPMAQPPPLALPAERFLIHRAVRSLLNCLAVRAPVVLGLDDLHWLDGASSELVIHLVSHPPSRGVLIAVSYRPAQLGDRVRAALDRGEAEGRVTAVEIGPLLRSEAELLVSREVPPPLIDSLYQESGGNPFYLLELARAPRARVGSSRNPSAPTEVPPAVIAAIEQEMATLASDAAALVRGAAVAGEPFTPELAAVAADIPVGASLAVLDRLVESGLIQATDVPRRFLFRHPLLRRAVYQSGRPGWRIAAHRRLAEALRERGGSAAEVAHHMEASAEVGDEQAISALTTAGQALAKHAPAVAAHHLEAALRLLPDEASTRRLGLLVPLATSLGAAGHLSESREALLDALSLLPPNAVRPRVELEAFCAAVEQLLGLHAEAHARLHAALGALPADACPEAAALMIELAADGLWRMDWKSMRDWAAEARKMARRAQNGPIEATALSLLAYGDYCVGTPVSALRWLGLGAALVNRMSGADLAMRLDAAYYLVYAEFFLERYEDANRHTDRGLAVARATGRGQFFVPTLTAKALTLRRLGRLREAAETAREAVDSARLAGPEQVILYALWAYTWVANAEGDTKSALAAGEEGLSISRQLRPSLLSAAAAWILGEVLLEAGDPVRCAAVVLDAAGGPSLPQLQPGERCYVWHVLARAEIQRRRYDAAQGWVDRLEEASLELAPTRLPRSFAQLARGHLLLARGDAGAAAQAALAAGDAADDVHARLDAARARLLAGRACAAAGERDRGLDLLEGAREELELCGAARYRDEAAHDLRRLGRKVGRGGRRAGSEAGVEALSERELQIAELVAAGMTNKQIGDELFLSIKTVERHLSHTFAKLNVSSRAQVGALLARAADAREKNQG